MDKKLQNIILTTYVIALIILIIGASYAYFNIIKVGKVSPEVNYESAITDLISFEVTEAINITANEENFLIDMGNVTAETSATAYLKSANTENKRSYGYNVYIDIVENGLCYSTASQSPELILTVTDPSGNILKNMEGLDFVTINGISGFDITTAKGKYFIANNYQISTDDETRQDWHILVTLVNLEENQDLNDGKLLEGYLKIEKGL